MKYLNDISYKDCVGKVCKSLNSGDFKIVKYNNKTNVVIQFLKTGYETTVRLTNIRKGYVKDPYLPSVYGVGILGTKYLASINGVQTKEYKPKKFQMVFDTLEAYIAFYTESKISNKDFDYEVIE